MLSVILETWKQREQESRGGANILTAMGNILPQGFCNSVIRGTNLSNRWTTDLLWKWFLMKMEKSTHYRHFRPRCTFQILRNSKNKFTLLIAVSESCGEV